MLRWVRFLPWLQIQPDSDCKALWSSSCTSICLMLSKAAWRHGRQMKDAKVYFSFSASWLRALPRSSGGRVLQSGPCNGSQCELPSRSCIASCTMPLWSSRSDVRTRYFCMQDQLTSETSKLVPCWTLALLACLGALAVTTASLSSTTTVCIFRSFF